MVLFYYLIEWTWGLPMTLIGLITFLIAKSFGCRTYWYRNAMCIVVPWDFGGLEMGMFFVRGEHCESVCAHEYGHSIQNLWWGPLMPFVICIPSGIRYWYREIRYSIAHKPCKTKYDDIWFEGQATRLGELAEADKWYWL